MPGAPSSFLFLVVRPGAPNNILAPNRVARDPEDSRGLPVAACGRAAPDSRLVFHAVQGPTFIIHALQKLPKLVILDKGPAQGANHTSHSWFDYVTDLHVNFGCSSSNGK